MRHNYCTYNPNYHDQSPPENEPGATLPAAIDRDLFSDDQLTYLEDTYHELALASISTLLQLVRYTPNTEPTLEEITLNIAILAKHYRLTPGLSAVTWDNIRARYHIGRSPFYTRKNTLIALQKKLFPATESALPSNLDPAIFTAPQRAHLQQTYRHLKALFLAGQRRLISYSHKTEPTLGEITLNVAILAKLYRLTPELATLHWEQIISTFHTSRALFYARKNALIKLSKHLHKQP